MSVNTGETVTFKIKSTTSNYHIDILRLGYYGGDGARLIAGEHRADRDRRPSRPARRTPTTGLDRLRQLVASRASWTVPDARGLRRLHRPPGAQRHRRRRSQISFVVRDDSSHSDIVLQTSDTTWQAYNTYGGNSLYHVHGRLPARQPDGLQGRLQGLLQPAVPHGRGRRRPLVAVHRRRVPDDPLPRAQRLRRQLHQRASTSTDRGSLLLNHKVFMSSGHDEYWSAAQRAERRGRARRRRQPRVLQRQRGVLEDALRAEHRRHQHAGPHARRPTRTRTSTAPAGPGRRGPAPGATRASRRRRQRHAGERAHRPVVPRQLGHVARSRCRRSYGKLRLWRNTARPRACRRAER